MDKTITLTIDQARCAMGAIAGHIDFLKKCRSTAVSCGAHESEIARRGKELQDLESLWKAIAREVW